MKVLTVPLLLACLFGGIAAVSAQEADYEDLESRADYAYFTEDANALRNVMQAIGGQIQKSPETAGPLLYLLGFAHYRLGLMLAASDKTAAGNSMHDCTESLNKAVNALPKSADAFALLSMCYGELAQLRGWQAMFATPLSALRMDKALKLEPANPRALLLDGIREQGYLTGEVKVPADAAARAAARFKQAIESFEKQVRTEAGQPTWGYADAYLQLGKGMMQAGDPLGARNALERALIIAPEFAAARRELKQLLGK